LLDDLPALGLIGAFWLEPRRDSAYLAVPFPFGCGRQNITNRVVRSHALNCRAAQFCSDSELYKA